MKKYLILILIIIIGMGSPLQTAANKSRRPVLYMIGDSTMADKDTTSDRQERGWGQLLPMLLNDRIRVENHAMNGRSTKSFIDEGRWDTVASRLQKGDYVVIQFGHNDEKEDPKLHTEIGGSFDSNLRRFISESRAKGATPILMNSIVRRNYPPEGETRHLGKYDKEGTVLTDTHWEYAAVPRRIAKETKVVFIDMTALTHDYVSTLGPEKSKALYMWIPAGKFKFCPKGKVDNTHLNPYGATEIARIALTGIVSEIPAFKKYLSFSSLQKICPDRKGFSILKGKDVSISLPKEPKPVLQTAVELLGHDLRNVFGDTLKAVDKNADISVRIDPATVAGQQGFRMTVDKKGRLEIAGHDSHGAAYGLIELTRLIGVSPWEWWADATPAKKESFKLPAGYADEQAPSVPYRGIFINDEDWGLNPWANKTFEPSEVKGEIGPKTNAKIFELMLRLRANYYWPAMHECTQPFFLTPGNREVAAKYGIYIGGSHCEPMASSTAVEWRRRGRGDYDYVNNSENVRKFWEDRVKDVAGQEIVYTLGMRGVHDGAMNGAKTVEEQKNVLTKAIADQRGLIAKYVNPDVAEVPQVFIPYKEVLDVYNAGLEVPDDVTLMWCDDNYGYIRHFPTEKERARKGGNGVYYHVSYWGRPHDYLWLGTFSPALLQQQMGLAYDRGIQGMWILNVGDIKPAEYQIELFMDMAWDIGKVRKQGVKGHLNAFLSREFGEDLAPQLTDAMMESYRLAFIRKPEFMANTRTEEWGNDYYNHIHDLPVGKDSLQNRLREYMAISDSVERNAHKVPDDRKDAYFQLVKYPVQGAAQLNRKLISAQFARHGEGSWDESDVAFDSIASLTRTYNEGYHNNGKWRGIMDMQPRLQTVFAKAERDTIATPLLSEPKPLHKWNGIQGKGNFKPLEGLGYETGAAALIDGEPISFEFAGIEKDSVTVDIRLLPNHPLDGRRLAFKVIVDGVEYNPIEYQTAGRSEEWKGNVLWNQARRRLTLPLRNNRSSHTLTLLPLTEGVILDQILLWQ